MLCPQIDLSFHALADQIRLLREFDDFRALVLCQFPERAKPHTSETGVPSNREFDVSRQLEGTPFAMLVFRVVGTKTIALIDRFRDRTRRTGRVPIRSRIGDERDRGDGPRNTCGVAGLSLV